MPGTREERHIKMAGRKRDFANEDYEDSFGFDISYLGMQQRDPKDPPEIATDLPLHKKFFDDFNDMDFDPDWNGEPIREKEHATRR
ncbi:MAG: hypothetical protein EZS28_009469 [Streblomastix strix]|uniref:Uncharacterized protein n=1 Tax=Streblomastix strix TaxID=222440 RepID=A0A5J4WKD8_9EUKA|nr:MAG: hypothetical protein EZS28_009469 [Streblomastix strix]